MNLLFLFLFLFSILPFTAISQPATPRRPPVCNGIFISYQYTGGSQLTPTNPTRQPYRFESTLTVQNNGDEELKSWKVFVGFQHDELLVSASNAVLADGSSLPASVGNGTVFAGYPMTNLKTAIETAGDATQTTVQVKLLGTQFGVGLKDVPLPDKVELANDGFVCPGLATNGTMMSVCCTKDPKFKANVTIDEEFLPRQSGDLTIMYDVTRTYDSSYWAQVTIENHNPLGRLDNWKLSWDWMRDEFIYTMKGAYPYLVDSTDCIFGPQGTYYQQLDFANVLNCERRPTIIDLPPTKANDTTWGLIPKCCRNGTILPRTMDASKSASAFQMQVFKMPPDLNRSEISPPQNWKINGTLNPDYQCGPPVRVSPSQFPDPSGLPSNTTAVASWQVVCNITHPKGVSPRCCVSFSAYYNDSVIPCNTCACGCPSNTARTCSATAPAILLPPEALLVPFENRTAKAQAWALIKHRPVPKPLPCSDNCGVSINWHVLTDYNRGWSARITLFNWQDTSFADWFAAVQLNKAAAGFEAMYSFNGSTLDGVNNTIFMEGLQGLNYLVAETAAVDPKTRARVPGKQQTVISFTKKSIPGLNIPAGDGFPTKVFFNGEECSLPSVFPTSNGHRKASALLFSVFLAVMVLMV
ncbi:COBRA-like protein 7 [Turnera subulata]|uniref:COBRA-like protein 7 n=1 Tax=Turnera subulata TaxID=218843 RepID=A0A9Q0GFT0_9ROSI|nr:COBRA-like protein 7 [Turnera subulata]